MTPREPRDNFSCGIATLLGCPEEEQLEFKAAKESYSFDKLREYCVAIANGGGGVFILGISDKIPRSVVGTNAFSDYRSKIHAITSQLGLKIEAREDSVDGKRVLRFHIPSRPHGVPLQVDGRYLMRSGEALVPMTLDYLRLILSEVESDFSAQLCPGARLGDLDPLAIEQFRSLWMQRTSSLFLHSLGVLQLLRDAELVIGEDLTYAALLLFGTREALGRFLPQAEVVWEYRTDTANIRHQQRMEFREGFLLFQNKLWDQINLRNESQQIQNGFFMSDIPAFNEQVVREAILNAICHRDYRLQSSSFLRQSPHKLEITNPGGFPFGITPENLLYKQFARNRRLAEALQKCGLIERSGQGVDTIVRQSLSEGKHLPDYSSSDTSEVVLKLDGKINDPDFMRFVRALSAENNFNINTDDVLVLDLINRNAPVPLSLKSRIPGLVDNGVIERVGSGRGTRYLFSRRFYSGIGRPGSYTRHKGLGRSHKKALIFSHLEQASQNGVRLSELQDVVPSAPLSDIKRILNELRDDGSVYVSGRTNGARWYASQRSKN